MPDMLVLVPWLLCLCLCRACCADAVLVAPQGVVNLKDWVHVNSTLEAGVEVSAGNVGTFVVRTKKTNHVFEAYTSAECDQWTNVRTPAARPSVCHVLGDTCPQ